MDRRQYLAAACALGVGSLAGCTTETKGAGATTDGSNASDTPRPEDDEGAYAEETIGEGTDAEGRSYAAEDHVELELNDRFVLDRSNIAVIVTGTEKRVSETTASTATTAGRATYVVRMQVANDGDDRSELDHGLFWLEGLDPEESTPVPSLSAPLEHGAVDDATSLAPGEERTLEIAFAVPPEFEPRYLWAKKYYVCLV